MVARPRRARQPPLAVNLVSGGRRSGEDLHPRRRTGRDVRVVVLIVGAVVVYVALFDVRGRGRGRVRRAAVRRRLVGVPGIRVRIRIRGIPEKRRGHDDPAADDYPAGRKARPADDDWRTDSYG